MCTLLDELISDLLLILRYPFRHKNVVTPITPLTDSVCYYIARNEYSANIPAAFNIEQALKFHLYYDYM